MVIKLNKRTVFTLILLLIFILPITVFGATYTDTTNGVTKTISITTEQMNTRENQTSISGNKPLVASASYSLKPVSTVIDNIYKDKIKTVATQRAKNIVFDYKVFDSKDYISILIISNIQNSTQSQQVSSVTFKKSNGQIVSLSDVLAGKPIDVLENYVNSKEDYGKTVSVNDSTTFYINSSNKPVLVFDSYKLGQKQFRYEEIVIDLSNVTSFSLPKSNYYIKDKFNIRMVPLRKTAQGLYFDVKWVPKTKTFTVSDNQTTASGNIYSYDYTVNTKKVALESKPELTNGTLYVPISFYTDALDLSYKIDNSGDITFYKLKK